MDNNNIIIKSSRHIVLIAMMSATLVAGKFVLMFIPNVEVVTTLIIIYAFVFKWDAIPAVLVFCTADILLYPPSLDVIISYYIYFNSLALFTAILSKLKVTALYVYLIYGIFMTLLFGLLTSFMTFLIFGTPFLPMYLSGFVFYALQVASCTAFMLAGFIPLSKVLTRLKNRYNS